jgi:hypothetical protein
VLNLTVYRGARDPSPLAKPLVPWEALCAEVETLCAEESAATDKRDLIAFGPYKLRDGTTRAAANVEIMAALCTLDIDGGDLPALRGRLTEVGADAIIHGSPSDEPNGTRKVRVFVRLDREHSPADAGAVRDRVAALLGVTHDPSTRNADRIFFCGRLAGTEPRYVERFAGQPLSIDALPAAPSAAPMPAAAPAPAPDGNAPHPAKLVALHALLAGLGPWQDRPGQKYLLVGAISGLMRMMPGWYADDAENLIRAWLPVGEPTVDVEAAVRWARKAWDRDSREVTGRKALDGIVGTAMGSVIEQTIMLPFYAQRDAPLPPEPARAESAAEFANLQQVDLNAPLVPLRYVIPGIELAPGKCSALQGFAYTSKTPFAILMGLCVAGGVPFIDMPTAQCPVLYLDFESSRLTEERIRRIRLGRGLPESVPFYYFRAEKLSAATIDEIRRVITKHRIGLVLCDTYSSAVPAETGNFNESSFRVWADALGKVSSEFDVVILLLLHENKGAKGGDGLRGISGHGSLAGALQAAVSLTQPDDDDPTSIRVTCARATRKGFKPFSVRWTDVPDDAAPDGMALVAEREEASETAPKKPHPHNENLARQAAKDDLDAAVAILKNCARDMSSSRDQMLSLTANRRAGARVLPKLTDAGLLQIQHPYKWAITERGKKAADTESVEIGSAVGSGGEFLR